MAVRCVNEECGFLAEDEPARVGDDDPWQCPECGSQTYQNALVGQVSTSAAVTLKISVNFWHAWARNAIRSAKDAARWRAEADAALEGQKAKAFGREFDEGMAAVAAAAFALDAFYASLAVPAAARTAAKASLARKPARHVVVREALKLCFQVDHATGQQWAADIKWLFNLRDRSVHPLQEFENPLPLADGSLSTVKREDYNAAAAARAVDIMLGVLMFCAEHPGSAYPEPAEWAASSPKGGVESLQTWWRTPGWHPLDA